MAAMEWTAELSVGITSIDDQHKQLVAYINELSAAMTKGEGNKKLEDIFDKIIKYTATHFAFEEKLFATHGYPATSAHKAEHEALVKEALELQKKFKNGQMAISVATHKFLMNWLTNHIMGTDKQYTSFMIGKGVK